MNVKVITGIILVCLMVGGGAAYYMYNKPHRDVENEKAAFTISASQLYDEYEADEAAANEKYLDQVIEVNGKIDEVRTTAEGKTMLIVVAENAMVGGVSMTFDSQVESGTFDTGGNVTAKCRCTGMLMDVVLTNCFL